MCREHAPEAVATLVAALRDPRHKVAAAEALLSRGFGKPPQSVSIESHATTLQLHLLAARGVSTDLLQELGLTTAPTPVEPETINMNSLPTE
jgi:hypothetical protein